MSNLSASNATTNSQGTVSAFTAKQLRTGELSGGPHGSHLATFLVTEDGIDGIIWTGREEELKDGSGLTRAGIEDS